MDELFHWFSVFLIRHMPFPSGWNRCGRHSILFLRAGPISVPNTLEAGSRASLSHISINIWGYALGCFLLLAHRRCPSVTRSVAVWASSMVNLSGLHLLGLLLLLLLTLLLSLTLARE